MPKNMGRIKDFLYMFIGIYVLLFAILCMALVLSLPSWIVVILLATCLLGLPLWALLRVWRKPEPR